MRQVENSKPSKIAIITGASKGLGRLIAQRLGETGYGVVDVSRTSSRPVDVTKPDQVTKLIQRVASEHGRIDVVVNNAGYAHPVVPLSQITDEELFESFQTNTFGPFFVMRSVIPMMRRQGDGMIVNIASKAAIYTVPGLGAYSASKAALVSLTQAAAKELRNTGILCVTVCPSGMRTQMRAAVYGRRDAKEQQSPRRVASLIDEIINKHTLDHMPINQGACIIIRKDKVTIQEMKDG